MAAVIGTDHLGRPLTDEEKRRFGALVREHDYPGKRLVALRFAYKLTRSQSRAQDLMGRVDLRLVRAGWNPASVPLVNYLCRLVWSEWTHESGESDKARRAEEAFVRELEVTEGMKLTRPARTEAQGSAGAVEKRKPEWAVPSHEEQVTALEASGESGRKASRQLEKLRAIFEKDGDEVNLLWMKHALGGETDMQKMAAATGRDVAEFYAASKRRNRAVLRLLGEERGVDLSEENL